MLREEVRKLKEETKGSETAGENELGDTAKSRAEFDPGKSLASSTLKSTLSELTKSQKLAAENVSGVML